MHSWAAHWPRMLPAVKAARLACGASSAHASGSRPVSWLWNNCGGSTTSTGKVGRVARAWRHGCTRPLQPAAPLPPLSASVQCLRSLTLKRRRRGWRWNRSAGRVPLRPPGWRGAADTSLQEQQQGGQARRTRSCSKQCASAATNGAGALVTEQAKQRSAGQQHSTISSSSTAQSRAAAQHTEYMCCAEQGRSKTPHHAACLGGHSQLFD